MNDQRPESTRDTSLLRHCKSCGSKCCLYSSPIVDRDERDRIVAATRRDLFLQIDAGEGTYYIIGLNNDGSRRKIAADESGAGEPCGFLDNNGRCSIDSLKPLDCAAYPLRAVPGSDASFTWHLHYSCPAAAGLSPRFFRSAAALAEQSATRFKPGVFSHWLVHFSRWTISPDTRINLTTLVAPARSGPPKPER